MGGYVKWSRSPEDMVLEVEVRVNVMREQLLLGVNDAMHEGEDLMRHYIETATTETGIARAAGGGGSPGRIDTGLMINSTNSRALMVDENNILGEVGWPDGEQYFLYQEDGTEKIEPMHALLNGWILAKERAIASIFRAIRGA